MKQNKRLLIVIWNMGIGGVQKRVRDVVLNMGKDYPDWEIHMLVKFKMPNNFMTPIERMGKARIYYLTNSHEDSKGIFSVFWLLYQVAKINPQVCLTFLDHLSVLMIMISRLFFWRRCRVVLNEGVVTSRYLKLNRRRWYWSILIRHFYPLANRIIVPSKAVKEDLENNFGVPQRLIKVIPNWTLLPLSFRLEKDYDLIYIGRFEREKNVLGFIEVVARVSKNIPKVKAIMLGNGSQDKQVWEEIAKKHLGENITLIGFSTEVAEYLNKSKILVLPTNNEGMPNVVLEAGACGVPTVASNFLGAGEVIEDRKTGYIGKDMTELAQKVVDLLGNEVLRKKMGRAANERIRRYYYFATQNQFIKNLLVG